MVRYMVENVKIARQIASRLLLSPVSLASVPALSLALFWFGGETALILAAIIFPFLCLLVCGVNDLTGAGQLIRNNAKGLLQRDAFKALADQNFTKTRDTGQKSAVFSVEIDENNTLLERFGQAATDTIVATVGERIITALRNGDCATQVADFRFAACLKPITQLDLELCIQLAGRLQTTIEEAISIDGSAVYVTASVGFCQNTRAISKDTAAWIEAADLALREAQNNGPGAIRAFSADMRQKSESRAELREEVAEALENGEIRPWFQPQISTDTGLVTGFEALARWHHPKRGMISPSDFLPIIERAGLLERLAEIMIYHSFTALKGWDDAGVNVPQVGVNFAGPELNNPNLVEKIKWELDRFDLTPDRLAVEVLETVVASAPDDMITRNINGLGKLGCKIDLDDFGTGHASLASIRRFSVSRIKIDRSFVMKSDRDLEQQRMISAILTMAERIGVETLAEGVESSGEHALLAQLGCDHVQGFGIGKPMPFDETQAWVTAHLAKLQDAPQIMGNKRY